MAGKNAFYLLFIYEQTYLNVPFYSNSAAEKALDVRLILNQLTDLKQFFDYETYKYFYDKRNLDSFVKTIKGGNTEKRTFMRKLHNTLKANNWNAKQQFSGSTRLAGVPVHDETFSFLTVHKQVSPSDVNAIIDLGAMKGRFPHSIVEILKPTIPVVHDWFSRNRVPARCYHWSSKHGENGRGNWPGEAVLLCSRQEAEQLLHSAIGIKERKDLYLFDKKCGKHMRFMYENLGNTYHSFHIEEREIEPCYKTIILKKLARI